MVDPEKQRQLCEIGGKLFGVKKEDGRERMVFDQACQSDWFQTVDNIWQKSGLIN